MRIPESVKVGPFTYAIVREKVVRADDDTRLCGQIDYQALRIRIAEEMAPQQESETFLHELIHGVDHNARIGLTEKQVTRLAIGLLGVLLDNHLLRED